MATIAQIILAPGPLANIPTDNSALTEGRIYFATDSGVLRTFRDNGATWDEVSSSGSPYCFSWAYADEAERMLATGFVEADVHKLALQLSDNTLWMLTAVTPTWGPIGGGGLTGGGGSPALNIVSQLFDPITVANTIAQTVVFTGYTIPKNSLGSNGIIRLVIRFDLNHTVAGNMTFSVYYGTTIVATIVLPSGTNTPEKPSYMVVNIANTAFNAQQFSIWDSYMDGTAKHLYAEGSSAVDTREDLPLSIKVTHDVANAGVSYVQKFVTVEQSDLVGVGGGSSVPTWFSNNPDNPPDEPDVMNDEFEGNALDPVWTTFGIGSPVFKVDKSFFNIEEGAVNNRFKGILRPMSGSSWKFRTHLFIESPQQNYNGAGFLIKNSANDKTAMLGIMYWDAHGRVVPHVVRATGYENADWSYSPDAWILSQDYYLELEYDGTDFILRYSSTGHFFNEVIRYQQSQWLLADPTHIGLTIHHSGPHLSASFDWFRRLA